MKLPLLSAGLLLSLYLPSASQAQTVPSRPVPRIFVGGSFLVRNAQYQVQFDEPSAVRPAPWLLTAGYRLTPRLAVQAGYGYVSDYDAAVLGFGRTPAGDLFEKSVFADYTTHLLPLLARYSLVHRPNPRLQLDALLGVTVLRSSYAGTVKEFVNRQEVSSATASEHATQAYAQAGLGLRYPFGPHLEGVLDWTYSRNLHASSVRANRLTTNNDWGLTRTFAMGMRYRFDVRRPG